MQHKTAVIILNWNGAKLLREFLPSVVKYTPNARIIVADNGSTDNSLTVLNSDFPAVEILAFDQNYGFAEGYNRALAQVDSEFVVLLNSDVEVSKNWLEPIIERLQNDRQIAACQPKIRAYHNKEQFEYAGAAGGFIDKYGYPFCRGRILDELETDTGQYDEPIEVFWASGACFAVRREVYNQLGGLDADFFAHMEEIDLCWRMKNAGYTVWAEPKSVVYHVGGASLSSNNPHKLYLNFRNNLAMLYKNLPSRKLLPLLFLRMVLDGISALSYIASGKFSFFVAVLKAHFSFYGMLPNMRAKRKMAIPINIPEKMWNKSILWSFFVRKQKKYTDLTFE